MIKYFCDSCDKEIDSDDVVDYFTDDGDIEQLCTTCRAKRVADGAVCAGCGEQVDTEHQHKYACTVKNVDIQDVAGAPRYDVKNRLPDVEAKKYDGGKLRWDLLPLDAVEEAVKRYTHGAEKYGDNQWQELPGGEARYTAALLRHLAAHRKGIRMDKDAPDLTNLSAVLWNAIALVWLDLQKQAEQ